jgi:hypothetical protein
MQKRLGVEASEASNRRTPMPKFIIERQYLVPMYQHIAVEAESLEEACKRASATISTGIPRRWTATVPGERRSLASSWFPTGTTLTRRQS